MQKMASVPDPLDDDEGVTAIFMVDLVASAPGVGVGTRASVRMYSWETRVGLYGADDEGEVPEGVAVEGKVLVCLQNSQDQYFPPAAAEAEAEAPEVRVDLTVLM